MADKKIIVDLEHLDTMNKYNAFASEFAAAVSGNDTAKVYELLATCVKEWDYAGDPTKAESYGELHPRSFRKVVEAVAAAQRNFFQD